MAQRIEDYALIGNMRSAALVGRDGSIDWLCLPRFDSDACFAALLGDRNNGRWLIAPREEVKKTTRGYCGETLILETMFETKSGKVKLIDFMPLPREDANVVDVVRIVEGIEGSVPMEMEAIIRFGYGKVAPWVRRKDYGLQAVVGPDALQLRTPLDLRGREKTTVAEFTISAGETIPCVLTWHLSYREGPEEHDAADTLDETEQWWRDWCSNCPVEGEWREAVVRSLITLKALTDTETGGMVAAATTSLPEQIGGERNWDYRYTWLRDATFTMYAMLLSGYKDEARDWREWLLRAAAGDAEKLQIMYGIAGDRRLPEQELEWLAGYEGSKPVRIGNGAYTQTQIDVYGEVMDGLYTARRHGLQPDDDTWNVQLELLRYLENHWRDADSGIWEMRGPPRDFTFSKVMAWVAVDRAVKTIDREGLDGDADHWRLLRDTIHQEICEKGFNKKRNTFVQYYGGEGLDAALLMMALVGFLPPEDPRIKGTVEAVQKDLMQDGFVLRYSQEEGSDGVSGTESAFIVCSFWLADNLAMMGREDEARALFEKLLSIRNDVGLLSEEYDPRTHRQLGNFPQAFSHVGLINTAHNLMRNKPGPAQHRAEQTTGTT
ncbi:MAG TPA: glycoside hydrolase family 15 protein [Gammaproteobacteria bacterium]|nr:glycoside hydrolase family 15 protein [Gammaproteobacteria bacterium]